MFKQVVLFSSVLLLFSACATKVPITWKERIEKPKVSTLSLVYDEYGEKEKPTLLFLHGFGESRHTWRFLVPELSKHYHLLMLDLKGFGDSPKTEDSYYSVYDQAEIVAHFIKQKKLHNLTVVGHSFGGGVALVLALMQKEQLINTEIVRLILISTMAYKQQLPSMLRTLKRPLIGFLAIHLVSNDWMAKEGYRYAFYNDNLIPKESVVYSSSALSQPLAKYAYLETVEQLIPDDIEKIEQGYRAINLPSLIVWGKEDVSIRVFTAHKLHRDLKHSKLVVLPHVGHMPQEEAPNRVSDEIINFMEESQ